MNINAYSVAQASPRAVLVNTVPGKIEMEADNWEWGRYDWFLVEGTDAAYVTIRSLQPDLIVLLMPMDGQGGCRLMSVLRLDAETASIPIMIYTAIAKDSDSMPSSEAETLARLN